jgi:hypothetical protein
MAYKAGGFYFPTSGGSFSVSGIVPGKPQGLILFGGNQSTEEAFVSGGTPGVFYGQAWLDQATGLIDQQASSNTSGATAFNPDAIYMLGAGTALQYRGQVTSFNDDGFTINVLTPAPGPRWIHYLALYDFEGCEGSTMFSTSNAVWDFLSLGYIPQTALSFHHWPNGADRDVLAANNWVHSMGVQNFPADLAFDVNGAQAIIARIQTQLGGVGWTDQFATLFDNTITLTIRPGSVGTILQADDKAYNYPARGDEGIRFALNGYPTRHSGMWWTGDASAHSITVPDLGQQGIITARDYIDEIEAALIFGTMGYTNTGGGNPQVLYVHGVIDQDYQGCVGFSSGIGASMSGTPGFFQSKEMCYVENLRSPGVRAASGELVGNQLVLTGEIEDEASPVAQGSYVNLYGPDLLQSQFFRVVFR